MIGLYLKVTNDTRGGFPTLYNKIRIGSFMVLEESHASKKHNIITGVWNRIPKDKQPSYPGNQYKFLRCLHCQHEDFSDDGVDLGIYTCNGCDKPVRICILDEKQERG